VAWRAQTQAGTADQFRHAVLNALSSREPFLTHLAVIDQVALSFWRRKSGGGAPAAPPPIDTAAVAAAVAPPVKWLKRIRIKNFKAIAALDLSFPDPGSSAQPWLMILGENGVGKSTVLQAVALAMMGDAQRATLAKKAHAWLRRGATAGEIALEWSDSADKFVLQFRKGVDDFTTLGAAPDVPVLAYGSTRLLPREAGPQVAPSAINVANLFDPLVPLAGVQAYLCNTKAVSNAAFDELAKSLKKLLALGESDKIVRSKTKGLSATIDKVPTPFDELSDGRRSMLALTMDMMFNLSVNKADLSRVEGLVLLDEIELHLHPRWKIAIVKLFRTIFPGVRFIVTTHDPLCAHGLAPGELKVMVIDPVSRKRIIEGIDIPPGARADQILTGPWFGLQSTIDDDTLLMMNEHSALLQTLARSVDQTDRMRELEQELRQRMGSFGDTQAQRALLAVNAIMHDQQTQAQMDQVSRARLMTRLAGRPAARDGGGESA
jgi:energy-coupling factor transporter ATP-binding protein EcfA2